MPKFEIVDLLEHATRQRNFPAVLELPHEVLGDCRIDNAASDALHLLGAHGMFGPQADLLAPALESAGLSEVEQEVWYEQPGNVVVDVGLSVYDSQAPVTTDTYIWFLLNRIGSGAEADPMGFAVPAARRVNGSPYHLQPLAMELTPATYTANVALLYGSELSSTKQNS